MRILIIGKYPPIEGGVSAHTYWLARGLGERGHQVSVVTNALRVEPENALEFSRNTTAVREQWMPQNVTLHSLKYDAPSHIPHSEAFVTRLTNAALRTVAQHGADVVYAHYLEPYATAGFMTKVCTGLPLVIRHAGSDVYRLLKSDDFSLVLSRVLLGADRVFLSRSLRAMADELRMPHRRIVDLPEPALHPAFSPTGPRYALDDVGTKDIPVIGYLGKANQLKGILELIEAVGQMTTEVRLILVTNGPLLPEIMAKIESQEVLRRRVVRIPFVGPWDVPGLLRRCDLLAHLENRFPIPIHTPLQPYEAIATETPLLLSAEMADKLTRVFPDIAVHATVVSDPRDTVALARSIDKALGDRAARREGARALRSSFANDWAQYVDTYERAFVSARRASLVRRMLRVLLRRA